MIVLRIEHKILNFEGWKKAFESDPVNRRQAGVRRYRIYRPVDDLNYVIIDLEFDTMKEADATLKNLEELWKKVEGSVMFNPRTQMLDLVENIDI